MRRNNYWEIETPLTADTGRNVLRFYPEAGKLWVSKAMWADEHGEKHHGKTVVVDLAALKGNAEAMELLKKALF